MQLRSRHHVPACQPAVLFISSCKGSSTHVLHALGAREGLASGSSPDALSNVLHNAWSSPSVRFSRDVIQSQYDASGYGRWSLPNSPELGRHHQLPRPCVSTSPACTVDLRIIRYFEQMKIESKEDTTGHDAVAHPHQVEVSRLESIFSA